MEYYFEYGIGEFYDHTESISFCEWLQRSIISLCEGARTYKLFKNFCKPLKTNIGLYFSINNPQLPVNLRIVQSQIGGDIAIISVSFNVT